MISSFFTCFVSTVGVGRDRLDLVDLQFQVYVLWWESEVRWEEEEKIGQKENGFCLRNVKREHTHTHTHTHTQSCLPTEPTFINAASTRLCEENGNNADLERHNIYIVKSVRFQLKLFVICHDMLVSQHIVMHRARPLISKRVSHTLCPL